MTGGTVRPEVGQPSTAADLRAEYRRYRIRQARGLVRMLPTEAIRPLYRRALARHGRARAAADPLGILVEYCERILPLPPFDVWMQDVILHPSEHLHDLDDSADAPTARDPATIEARLFEHDRAPWVAHLRSFRDGVVWRGYIAFEDQRNGDVHRTALVFREADPADLRERFLSFEPDTLEAFLRSALP